MDKVQIQTLKTKVEICLEKFPETRNSDVELTIRVWRVFHKDKLNANFVHLNDLFALPREDTIKRIRAQIQNRDQRFLPTAWEVAKKRKINQEVWERAMAANVPSTLME